MEGSLEWWDQRHGEQHGNRIKLYRSCMPLDRMCSVLILTNVTLAPWCGGYTYIPFDTAYPVALLFTHPFDLLSHLSELVYTSCVFVLQFQHCLLVATVQLA